jgi:hypothetical protein
MKLKRDYSAIEAKLLCFVLETFFVFVRTYKKDKVSMMMQKQELSE